MGLYRCSRLPPVMPDKTLGREVAWRFVVFDELHDAGELFLSHQEKEDETRISGQTYKKKGHTSLKFSSMKISRASL